LALLIY